MCVCVCVWCACVFLFLGNVIEDLDEQQDSAASAPDTNPEAPASKDKAELKLPSSEDTGDQEMSMLIVAFTV